MNKGTSFIGQLEIFDLEKNEIHENQLNDKSILIWRTNDDIQILDENNICELNFNDLKEKKLPDFRTILHLVCESGEFKLINKCFNNLTWDQFEQLEKLKTKNDETPLKLAQINGFDKKLEILKRFNRSQSLHKLVKSNQTKKLLLLLEYLSANCLLDTIDFGLKDNQGKTPIELAIDQENFEAIYLLNHFELNNKYSMKKYNNDSIDIDNSFLNFHNYESLPEIHLKKPSHVRNLIFQGGGIKGLGYLGALNKLSEEDESFDLKKIQRIGGTSAGAITAVLLGCGYSLEELEDELKKFDFKETFMEGNKDIDKLAFEINGLIESFSIIRLTNMFLQNRSFFTDILSKLTTNSGLFSGEAFRKYIEEKVSNKLGFPNATFKDLQAKVEENKSGDFKYKYLFLTGSNLSTGKCEIFSHLHSPNMIISDAVRISMSIPFVFYPTKKYIRNEKTGSRIVDPQKLNSLYVDGGLMNNYPIRMFDSTRVSKSSETNYINSETLGFKLVTKEKKQTYETHFKNMESADKKVDKFSTFLAMLIDYYVESEESLHSDRVRDQERSIYIDTLGISPVEFGLNDEGKMKLIESGRNAVADYLQLRINRNALRIQSSSGKYQMAFLMRGQQLNQSEANICFQTATQIGFKGYFEGKIDRKQQNHHVNNIMSVTVLPDQSIATGDSEGTVKVWNPMNDSIKVMNRNSIEQIVNTNQNEQTSPLNIDINLPKKVLEIGNQIKEDLKNKALIEINKLKTTLNIENCCVLCLAALPDGRLVSGGEDKKAVIWDVATCQSIRSLKGHTAAVNCIAVLVEGECKEIATGSNDKTIIIWDVNIGQQLKVIIGHELEILSLISLKENQLASSSADASIKIWNLSNGNEMKSLTGHKDGIQSVIKLSDQQLASGSLDKTIRIWNCLNRQPVHELKHHNDAIKCLLLLKDGNTLASASQDKTIKLWNIKTGKLIKTLEGHTDCVNSLALLANGQMISASADKSLIVWK